MVKLPSRKELAARIDDLESHLQSFAVGAGTGAVLTKSPVARTAARAAIGPLILPAAVADVAIRGTGSIPVRAGFYTADFLMGLVEGASERMHDDVAQFGQKGLAFSPAVPISLPKRKKSKFNKAVSVGMKAVKASKAYGPKGKITGAKKAFSAVTKIASKIRRGLKVSRTGTSGIIARAVSKVLKKPKTGTIRQGGR